MIRKFAILTGFCLTLTLTLAACGDSQPVVEDDVAADPAPVADVAIIPVLQPVNRDDIGIAFVETLGVCSFTAEGETLLVAGATSQDGSVGVGVVNMSGEQMQLEGTELGGPDALSVGPLMFAGDYTVEIERTGTGSSRTVDSTSYDATLLLRKDGSSEVTYGPGTWECSV